MKLHAIYVSEFPPFKGYTINFDSRYDYTIQQNPSAETSFQIDRVSLEEKFNVFKNYNSTVTGISGKNGSGKTTIALLLKNIYSGQPVISGKNRILTVYETDEGLFLDEYVPKDKYISHQRKQPITILDSEFQVEGIENLTLIEKKDNPNKWKKIEKTIVFYSSVLSDVNDYYYQSENIINLSLDYKVREFIEENRELEKKKDIFGFSTLINDFFQKQSEDFMKLVFDLKLEFQGDPFFTKIIELPETIDYYSNIELPPDKWTYLGIDLTEVEELKFINKLYLKEVLNDKNVNDLIADQLKALRVYQHLIKLRMRNEKSQLNKIRDLIISNEQFSFDKIRKIEGSLNNEFTEIDTIVKDVQFTVSKELFTNVSAECDLKAKKLHEYTSTLNRELGVDFISFNMKQRFSSGERVVLNLFSSLERVKDSLQGSSPTIFIDEIDQNLHPEWQRLIVYQLLIFFKLKDINNSHLIFTTHSPFVISDIPNNHLKVLNNNVFSSVKGDQSFAGNISDVLYEIMNVESFNGSFTHEVVNDALNFLNRKDSELFTTNSEIKEFIKIIGEPLLKSHLSQMLRYKQDND